MTPEAEVDLLEAMCSMYSPSGEEGEIALYLVEHMRSLGWDSYIDAAGNAVGEYGEGPETIMLLGHMDTVPGFIPVEIRDGILFGRGAVDAKGPLAAFICAAARSAGGRRRVVVVGAAGEETDESPGAGHLARTGVRPDYCVIGEPGGWSSVTLGYRGRLAVEAVVRQTVGHPTSGRPSAIETAVDLWDRVAEWARAWPEAAPGDTGAAGGLEGDVRQGSVRRFERLGVTLRDIRRESDHFQEAARLSMDFRLPPGLAPDRLSAALTERFPAAEFEFKGGQQAWRGGKGNSLVRAFVNSIREQGGNPGFKLKLGTSDMNVVAPAWNCPIVAFGPGDSSLDHTPGEHISIREYQSSIAILSRVLEIL